MSINIYNNIIANYEASSLLNKEQFNRLASTDFLDAVKILFSYGYVDAGTLDIDAIMLAQYKKLFLFLTEHSTSSTLLKFILSRYYYLDAKTLYLENCTVDELYLNDVKLKKAIVNKKYDALAKPLQVALKSLNENSSRKEIDFAFLDANFKDNLTLANSLGKKYLEYAKYEIDLSNILTAYRAKKLNFSFRDFYSNLFCGGTIDLEEFECLKDNSFDFFAYGLSGTSISNVIRSLKLGDTSTFKANSDQFLFGILSNEMTSLLKHGAFLTYALCYLSEFKVVNFILVSLKNNIKINKDQLWSVANDIYI